MTDSAIISPARDNLHYWLALQRVPGVGVRRFQRLLASFNPLSELFAASPQQLQAAAVSASTARYLRNPDWEAVDSDLQWAQQAGNHIVLYTEPTYPERLREIPDPPPLLFVHGDPDYLGQPQLAIVGSRNPSRDGEQLAHEFASFLAAYGLTITSGLASGIDTAAHRGALAAGGTTIAVTGTGLDRVYPAGNRALAHQIAGNGALVSEFPPGTAPLAANFPRRNRIISGLCVGTLIVEAAIRSGSLITARAARDQGREVFAIPGSLHNPLARGCHALIREGAKLVETGGHILEELAGILTLPATPDSAAEAPSDASEIPELATDYKQLLDHIGYDPVTVDQLVNRSGLTPQEVSSMLLVLELEDYLVSGAGGQYSRAR